MYDAAAVEALKESPAERNEEDPYSTMLAA